MAAVVITSDWRGIDMITLHYFASVRESTGRHQDQLELPGNVGNVRELVDYLVASDTDALSILRDDSQVLVAVDQTVVDRSFPLTGNEEVAFFPPMTGG